MPHRQEWGGKASNSRARSIYTQSCGSAQTQDGLCQRNVLEFKSHHQDAILDLYFPVQISVPGTAGTHKAFLGESI